MFQSFLARGVSFGAGGFMADAIGNLPILFGSLPKFVEHEAPYTVPKIYAVASSCIIAGVIVAL